MKKALFTLTLTILLLSVISAEIIINEQPKNLYNIEDTMNIPIKITALNDVSSFFLMYLFCDGRQIEVHKEFMEILEREETQKNIIIPLTLEILGKSTATCTIKTVFAGETKITNEFRISDKITINIKEKEIEFAPEETIIIEGDAVKENGELVNGLVNLKIISNDLEENIELTNMVIEGYFYLNLSLPKDTKSGQYLLSLNIYEKNKEGNKTNTGFTDYNIYIIQVPTSLEIIFENSSVEPGTNLRIKTILRDQTGEKITSTSIITIKDNMDRILEQTEKPTEEFLEFPIAYNEPPAEWNIFAVSSKLTSEATFEIKEKEDIKVEIINRTATITNTGNVLYNDTILVKINEERVYINIILEVDEYKKYLLSAPEGEYAVEIITSDGEIKAIQSVVLTGKAISVKEATEGFVGFVRQPIVWIFIIIILALISFIIFKKGYKRSFFGYISSKKKDENLITPVPENSLIGIKNKALLSLSLKGDKQNISLVSLKIKDLKNVQSKKFGAQETFQKILNLTEKNKAYIYENQDNLFFMFVPSITRTFKNERITLDTANQIKDILTNHNKLFKNKIEFGIALNYGTIIAKKEGENIKFMSMGTLINSSKKISSISNGEILLSEKIKERLMNEIKTEKKNIEGIDVYTVKNIRERKENNEKFISDFVRRNKEK